MSLYESCDFSEGVIKVAKIKFSLERVHGRIFLTQFEGKFFAGIFPGPFFLRPRRKYTAKKTPQKLSQ